jgi:hypothetical protein
MMLRDEIAAELPAPCDDEPESLRQDIVDELADHLQCALHRELLASGHQASGRRQPADSSDADNIEHTAWQQVLTHFGNPASLARKLWFDAMKERLMAQRFTAILAGVTAAAVVVVAVLLWRGIDQQAQAAAAVQQSNAALLERLATLLERQPATVTDQSAEDREMRHLDLRLVLDQPDGPPAVGYELAPAGVSDDDALVRLAGPRTDEDGRATLSMNRIGQFYLSITTPDGWVAPTLIPMVSENPQEVTLVVPAPAPPVQDLTIHVPRPDELSEQEYLFALTLTRPARKFGGLEWFYAPEGINAMSGREDRLLVAGDGHVVGRVVDIETSWESGSKWDRSGAPDAEQVVFKTVPLTGFPAGEYDIVQVVAFAPLDDPDEGQRDRLGAVRGVRYEFAAGTATQSVQTDGADWTITLPGFVWQREIDGPPFGIVNPIFASPGRDGRPSGGHGGGFF